MSITPSSSAVHSTIRDMILIIKQVAENVEGSVIYVTISYPYKDDRSVKEHLKNLLSISSGVLTFLENANLLEKVSKIS
jgi:hypothetical protein